MNGKEGNILIRNAFRSFIVMKSDLYFLEQRDKHN